MQQPDPPRPDPADDDAQDAQHSIATFSSLINNADAKAGLAAAAVAALVAMVAQQNEALAAALSASSATERVALACLVLFAAACLTAVVSIGVALVPRTPAGTNGGRFSYPTVAEDDWRFTPADRAQAAEQAWSQARTLARILKRKFAAVKVAVYALGGSFVAFCVWTVAASLT